MHRKGYILVEGRGEVRAVQNLIARISNVGSFSLPWTNPLRWPNLHQWRSPSGRGGLENGANFTRSKADAGALLILRDEDDACPKEVAPQTAQSLRDLRLPFPSAYVLLHPEYEVLFLPCLDRMVGDFSDGRTGLTPGSIWDRDSWEARRGVKEWLSNRFPEGRIYKPTLDQLPMTQKIDLEILRQANVPSFGSLERAVKALAENRDQIGFVYPPAALA